LKQDQGIQQMKEIVTAEWEIEGCFQFVMQWSSLFRISEEKPNQLKFISGGAGTGK